MGLYRTLIDAQQSPRPAASWKERVILRVTLADGREFFRAYIFDQYAHKCKRCRHAFRRVPTSRHRMACSGHVCSTCGNPYAGMTRRFVVRGEDGTFQTTNSWGSGRAH